MDFIPHFGASDGLMCCEDMDGMYETPQLYDMMRWLPSRSPHTLSPLSSARRGYMPVSYSFCLVLSDEHVSLAFSAFYAYQGVGNDASMEFIADVYHHTFAIFTGRSSYQPWTLTSLCSGRMLGAYGSSTCPPFARVHPPTSKCTLTVKFDPCCPAVPTYVAPFQQARLHHNVDFVKLAPDKLLAISKTLNGASFGFGLSSCS